MKFNEEEPINNFCDCVFIKIHGVPQSGLILPKKSITFELQLTYRFGEHTYCDPNSTNSITFGITEGRIILECENVIFPEEKRGFAQPFSVEYSVHRTEEDAETQKHASNLDLKLNWINPVKLISAIFLKLNQENTTSDRRSDSYNFSSYQCRNEGTENKPIIHFFCEPIGSPKIRPFLSGGQVQQKIGIAKIISLQPWRITAYFEINKNYIKILKFNHKRLDKLNWIERFRLFFVRKKLLRKIGDRISHARISSR